MSICVCHTTSKAEQRVGSTSGTEWEAASLWQIRTVLEAQQRDRRRGRERNSKGKASQLLDMNPSASCTHPTPFPRCLKSIRLIIVSHPKWCQVLLSGGPS